MSKQRVEISKNVLTECLGLRSGENLVVIADDMKRDLAESIYEAGKALGAESVLLIMEERSRSGEEPPAPIAEAMIRADVAVCNAIFINTYPGTQKSRCFRDPSGNHAWHDRGYVCERSHYS